ncbi:SBBP repeat-containing protein [Lacipirellula parvula]|uniref:Beta-propeller repeat protein n=1 Tax=Lacipirellula parvula TaxID=2650471 RepID=A0A5K7X7V0_9BACT|nr:SBBP repeat-containing protein [Lacipirellula parvula]BBO31877.1 hypothetical protein PLANPX_1489 [Lacipirellula parvula]
MFRAAGSWFMALATNGRKRKLRRSPSLPKRRQPGSFSRSLRMEGLEGRQMLSMNVDWIAQQGTTATDENRGVSADGLGNVYTTGYTSGSLGGASAGGIDALLSKYDSSGALLWTRQFGTSARDEGLEVSADGLGNVYITGRTAGNLAGTNAGNDDVFVRKYDASGTALWTRQFGTSSVDHSSAIVADGLGNIYVSGVTFGSLGGPSAGGMDGFVRKYDASGAVLWTRQFGTSASDDTRGISLDGMGNVHVTGYTSGNLGGTSAGGQDAYLMKYNASGTLLGTQQLGTAASDVGTGVSADGLGNVYITGVTLGNLGGVNAGDRDIFVSKYDSTGTLLWTQQLGTASLDVPSGGMVADAFGGVYISGRTEGNLGGTSAGASDAFVTKYDASGTLLWTEQFGTSGDEETWGISTDGFGSVYISGLTNGSLGGANVGLEDVWVARIHEDWIAQLGTASMDEARGSSTDELGNVYISGFTLGNLGGTNAGGQDGYVSKYAVDGTLLWTRQFGTTGHDIAFSVSADGLGNVYAAGYTAGNLGGANAGFLDVFVTKYSASGTLLWTQQLGSIGDEIAYGISADGLGNVYVGGYTTDVLAGTSAGGYDAFVCKYDASGVLLWTRQFGVVGQDMVTGVSADGLGGVYLSGHTYGSLGGASAGLSDAFIAKYDASGTQLWGNQIGTSGQDSASGVSADGLGNVYISGTTEGSLGGTHMGGNDAYIAKYNSSGTLLWIRQLGTTAYDLGYAVSTDGMGNAYLVGRTDGNLFGTNAGAQDAFFTKYDASGTLLWTEQLGTSGTDIAYTVSADSLGNVFAAGMTSGSLGGPFIGVRDAWIARL